MVEAELKSHRDFGSSRTSGRGDAARSSARSSSSECGAASFGGGNSGRTPGMGREGQKWLLVGDGL